MEKETLEQLKRIADALEKQEPKHIPQYIPYPVYPQYPQYPLYPYCEYPTVTWYGAYPPLPGNVCANTVETDLFQ